MSEQIIPFAGGQSDFLSLVNAEVEKVEPTIKVSLTPPNEQPLSPYNQGALISIMESHLYGCTLVVALSPVFTRL